MLAACLGSGCYLAHGPGEDAPRDGITCLDRTCVAGEEACLLCDYGRVSAQCVPAEEADELLFTICPPRGLAVGDYVARCDGPEDCEAGEVCVGFGAAIGSTHLLCSAELARGACHEDRDCAEGRCAEPADETGFRFCGP